MIDTAPAPERAPDDTTDSEIIRFPGGLLGFPSVTEYRLSEGPGAGLFWLSGQGTESPCFLLSDPFHYFDGLNLDLSPAQTEQIDAQETGQVAVLAVTVPSSAESWTANLQGPVVINVERSLGAQVVLADQSLGVRREFRPDLGGSVADTTDAPLPTQ